MCLVSPNNFLSPFWLSGSACVPCVLTDSEQELDGGGSGATAGSSINLLQVSLIRPSTVKGAPTEAFDVVTKGRQARTFTFSPTIDDLGSWLKPLCSIVAASAVDTSYTKWREDEWVMMAMASLGDGLSSAPAAFMSTFERQPVAEVCQLLCQSVVCQSIACSTLCADLSRCLRQLGCMLHPCD